MRQFINRDSLVSFFFLILISLPLFLTVINNTETFSVNEKRSLSSFPRIDFSASSLLHFPKKFEAFFEDHFGFRAQIVRLHNWLLWRVFATSSNNAVVVGDSNWFFLSGDGGLNDSLGQTQFNTIELEKFKRVIKDREYWLNSLGTHYLFLPIPNKESIYNEHLPTRIRQYQGKDKYTQIIGYLKKSGQLQCAIDVQDLMLNNKQHQQLYHRTDSHWNSFGIHLVYGEIIKRLQSFLPEITPVKVNLTWDEKYSGDLAMIMNLNGVLSEKAPLYEVQPQCTVQPLSRMKELIHTPEFKNTSPLKLPVKSGCEGKTSKAILLHDSFGNSLRSYLTPNFKTIIFVQYYNFQDIKSLIAETKPDIVIDEKVSRNLEKALVYDQDLESEVLKTKFDQLPKTVLRIAGANWYDYAANSKELSTGEEGHYVDFHMGNLSSSIDVSIDSRIDDPVSYAVQFVLHSSSNTEVSACYSSAIGSGISDRQCEERSIYKGQNVVYFRIFQPSEQGVLTLKFGNLGMYRLFNLTVKIEDH